jgi:hypothetical protein
MPAIDFPDEPEVNDTFTVGSITWKWNGSTWQSQGISVAGPAGEDGADGADGEPGPAGADGEANFSSFLLMGA